MIPVLKPKLPDYAPTCTVCNSKYKYTLLEKGKPMKKYFFSVLTLLMLSASPKAGAVAWPEPGKTAPRAVVSLHEGQKATANNQVCSGTLVAPTWVLTAAHCVLGMPDLSVAVGFGTANVSVHKTNRYVLPVDMPEYAARRFMLDGYDIALLELSAPVDNVRPATVAVVKKLQSFKGDLTLYGFGSNHMGENSRKVGVRPVKFVAKPDGVNGPRSIMATPVKPVKAPWPTNYCSALYCFKGYDSGACPGDSGGPIIGSRHKKQYVLAVVSYGFGDCAESDITVYTKVNYFVPWILSVVSGN